MVVQNLWPVLFWQTKYWLVKRAYLFFNKRGTAHTVMFFMSSCVGGSKAPPRTIYLRAARAISTSCECYINFLWDGWREERSSEGEEQEKASDGEGTSAHGCNTAGEMHAHAQRGLQYIGVCLSVTQHLTSPVFFRLTNDTTYLTGNEGRKFVRFSLKILRCKARALPALCV